MSLQGICRTFSFSLARHECRSFHSTPLASSSYKSRHGVVAQVRIPSKRAMAAKERRRALISAKSDTSTKLTPSNAIQVLKAITIRTQPDTLSLLVRTKLGSGIAVPRGRYKLPREPKESAKHTILVFAEGRAAQDATRAGAHIVGGVELIDGLVSGRVKPTTILCTTALIKPITPRLGRVLGPLGLMPNARRGTVTDDIKGYIEKLSGTSEFKADKFGIIRLPFAKSNWEPSQIQQNLEIIMQSVKVATGNVKKSDQPTGSHAAQITKVEIGATQGPGIKLIDW